VKRHGRQPRINEIPGQEFGLTVKLSKPEPTPAPAETPAPPAGDCTCDPALFWSTGGEYSQTSLLYFNEPSTYPTAALTGDTCPGADLSGITVSWVGGTKPPTYEIVEVDQVWSLVITGMTDDQSGDGAGTLTIGGSIVCNEETINLSSITMNLFFESGGG
jgi:hypothetical protein